MHMPLPSQLHFIADALMTVPARQRPALAASLIHRAGEVAEKRRLHNARFGRADLPASWGQELASVCLTHKLDCEAANPGTFYIAGIGDRDGIQAYEVALAALLEKVREAEAVEEAA
jgi:hypothetical protein